MNKEEHNKIIDFVNSEDYMLLNSYISKPYEETIIEQDKEIERLNKIIEDIDTYIHLWKLDEINEKTMLILNDILLIKNGMSNLVVRLKEMNK